MKTSDIKDPFFLEAVEAIDGGNLKKLIELLQQYPQLVHQRLEHSTEGYFAYPYLLWFTADNPIRNEKLPENIVDITKTIIDVLSKEPGNDFQYQLDYALGLVSTGRIAKECGVQIPLMELLINEGANVKGNILGVIGQHNFEAAKFLLHKGADYNLATAVALERQYDIERLTITASAAELHVALMVASFFGNAELVAFLLNAGADTNGQATAEDFGGFHSHASPLHQAAYSGSLPSVQLLVDAGADLSAKDKVYHGTPLEWAIHMLQEEELTENARQNFEAIAALLKNPN